MDFSMEVIKLWEGIVVVIVAGSLLIAVSAWWVRRSRVRRSRRVTR